MRTAGHAPGPMLRRDEKRISAVQHFYVSASFLSFFVLQAEYLSLTEY